MIMCVYIYNRSVCVCMHETGNVCTGYHMPVRKSGLALYAYWMNKREYVSIRVFTWVVFVRICYNECLCTSVHR